MKKGTIKLLPIVASLVVIFIFLISILQITNVIDVLGGGDYGTGKIINTTSKKTEVNGGDGSISIDNPYIKVENSLNHNDLGEVLDSSKYIVSWQPGEYSVRITARVDFLFKTRYDQLWSLLYGFGSFPTTFFKNNYWWDISYTSLSGNTIKIIDGKNFTGGSGDQSVKTNYVHVVQGYPKRAFPNLGGILESKVPQEKKESGWWSITDSSYPTETMRLESEVFVFEMKGNCVGSLNVKCYLQDSMYAHHDEGIFPLMVRVYKKTGPVLLSEDNAYLPTGRGEVRVESVGAIKSDGTDTTDETGIVYTKYVFEEGAPVVFSVDTGYSGVVLEPDQVGYHDGWFLQIVNSKGKTVQSYPLSDDLKNYKVTYEIPAGSFIPNDPGDNEWLVVLSNTLFDQSESRIFVIDSYEKMPGKTTLTVASNQVDQFQTISWTATALPNPSGTNDIHHFKIWATYDSETSTDYALTAKNYPAGKMGSKYIASDSFQVAKGDKNVYITCVAVDSEGRAGIEGQQIVFVEQVIPSPDGDGGITETISNLSQYVIYIIVAFILVIVVAYAVLYYRKRKRMSKK